MKNIELSSFNLLQTSGNRNAYFSTAWCVQQEAVNLNSRLKLIIMFPAAAFSSSLIKMYVLCTVHLQIKSKNLLNSCV